jgi:hypothetical protein
VLSVLIRGKVLPFSPIRDLHPSAVGCVFPINRSADVPITRSPLPVSSQIGVEFRDPASIGVELSGFAFPISRDVGDPVRSRRFCSPLPASLSRRPTPHRRFVENKGQNAIRPSGDRAVETLFLRFSAIESGPISAFFSRFYCSVGRGSQSG